MTDKPENPRAFPTNIAVGVAGDVYDSSWNGEEGLTMRDHFAGQALIGLLASSGPSDFNADSVAEAAHRYADAMLKARQS